MKKYFIVILLVGPIFSLLPSSTQPTPCLPLPQSFPTLLFMSVGHSYMFLTSTFPCFHHYPPLACPLVTFSLFHVSMPLVLFCLLVYFVH